jgi:hypothetical protein
MPDVAELAQARQDRLIGINDTASRRAITLWRGVDVAALDASWAIVGPSIVAQVRAAQLAAAAGSDLFAAKVAGKYESFEPESARIVPVAFAGVDGQGRDVAGSLLGSVTTTKKAIGAGFATEQAFAAGATYLAAIVKTIVADTSRAADMVAATGKGFTSYVRVISPGACSRCAILAGISDYKDAFKRHPACKCSSCPVVDDVGLPPAGLFDNLDDYFDSMSKSEQDRVFTQAGAQAIRDGADPSKVVSARRGATGISTSRGVGRQTVANSGRRIERTTIGFRADGSHVEVFTTSEGTTRRGAFGRAGGGRRVRLMPESIYEIASSPEDARILLRDGGYLITPRLSPQAAAAQRITDRARAAEIYRAAGITAR